jgi:hypothetical protein
MLQDLLGGNDPSGVDRATADAQPGANSPPAGDAYANPSERSANQDETLEQAQVRATVAEERARKADEVNGAHRERIAKEALDRTIAAREERIAADAQAVEDGDITPAELLSNADMRRQEAVKAVEVETSADGVLENLQNYGTTGVRYEEAVKLADKLSLRDIRPLMDKSFTSIAQMTAKAEQMAEDARTGNETYDGGRAGSAPPRSTNGLHGLDLTRAAYSDEETAKRRTARRNR